ncbi:dUTP diphosphatase [Heliophilum fasciatum]|uniref:dUTP diphosphatase n=1 Tax=Heliophilum fasciatum TaxID=35700 RepID=A0A4R2RE01_9FIRM|nr:dUTP diphosphatase [Heliophilum fasciatum]MCW2279288.1 dUTP pyrophosphatase [Heliophilum fasciatum]TCP60449.1 dUTP pyrophosphatase [Heliophilum fasciatum]
MRIVKTTPIRTKRLHSAVEIPERATPLASGFDLRAFDVLRPDESPSKPFNPSFENYNLLPGEWCMVRTGIAIQMSRGIEAQVRPRSGLAWKHGITVLNTPGTIDADYTGGIGVILINLSTQAFVIKPGERIAQMVFPQALHDTELIEVDEFTEQTKRADGGFGHTGRD